MDFIKKLEDIENVVNKNSDIIGFEAKNILTELSLQSADKNLEALSEIDKNNRLLQIGIIGRVNAGKSSLLNALLFNGKSLLPKAATPMTAALTVISYGETLSAKIDFFTDTDIDNIKREHSKYLEEKSKFIKIYEKELTEKKEKKLKSENGILSSADRVDISEKAERKATRELKNSATLVASYDQYEKIKNSKSKNLAEVKEKYSSIISNNFDDLSEQLLDYVGADGKYMPFTKSVNIEIPNDNLKDIQIVDTPGVNDPVQSREERTRELLKYCDVILIVSPAGQFINSTDVELMDKITTKEGVRELFVVASQADNLLSGNIKRDSNGDLNRAVDIIKEKLSAQMYSTIMSLKKSHPEIAGTYDQLIEQDVSDFIYSSGMCQSIIEDWDNRDSWDSDIKTVWNNLSKHYPDNFSYDNRDISIESLKMLSNMNSISDIIQKVREKKDEILSEKKDNFINDKTKLVNEYRDKLISSVERRIDEIQNNSIDDLRKQKNGLEKAKKVSSIYLDERYYSLVESLNIELKNSLTGSINSFFNRARSSTSSAESEDTETYQVKKGGIGGFFGRMFGGGYEDRTNTFTTVRTGAIRSAIETLINSIEDNIQSKSSEILSNWSTKLPVELMNTIRGKVDDEHLEAHKIMQCMRNVLNRINYPDITYNNELPSNLKATGTLKKSEADNFINASESYISKLQRDVRADVLNYLTSLIGTLKKSKISDEFFGDYDTYLTDLEEQINNKEITIDKFNMLLKSFKNIG